MSPGTAVRSHGALQNPVCFCTKLNLGESAAGEPLLWAPSSLRDAAARAAPAPPAGPAGRQVRRCHAGFWARRFPRRPRPGLPAASAERPISRSPILGPPAAGRRPGPASLTCARRSAATPQAQTDRLQPPSSSKRPRPGRGRPGAGSGCPAPAPAPAS